MRTFLKITILLLLLLSFQKSYAQYDVEPQEIRDRISDLADELDDLVGDITIRTDDLIVRFPMYQSSLNTFKKQAKDGADQFSASMKTLTSYISTSLSKEYSELRAVQRLYDQNKTPALKKLLKDKKRRLKQAKKDLQKQIDSRYQKAINKLATLNGHLIYPVKVRARYLDFLGKTYGNPITTAVIWIGTLATGVVTSSFSAALLPGALTIGSFALIGVGYDLDYDFNVYGNNGELLTINGLRGVRAAKKQFARKVFSTCKTAGCVYLMADNYKFYLKQIRKLNKSKKLVSGLKLNKLKAADKKRNQRRLNKLAKLRASELPIGDFQ